MKISIPRGAVDGPGIRITPKRVDRVRIGLGRTRALRCCSGRSLKCLWALQRHRTTSLAHAGRRQWPESASRITWAHSPGRMAAVFGSSTAAPPIGFSRSCCSNPNRVDTAKSVARAIDGPVRRPAHYSAGRSPVVRDERKTRLAGSTNGSPGRNQLGNSYLFGLFSCVS